MRSFRLRIIFAVLGATCWALRCSGVEDLSAGLFTNSALVHFRIDIPAPGMEILRGYTFHRGAPRDERPDVLCTVREGTSIWTNVTVHLKGTYGSFRSVDSVPAFTLNFSKQAARQRFHGLEKISLNNSIQDPSRLSEKLCRELYTRGGIPVPRAGHATPELNGRSLGLYVLLEGWDRNFVRRHFSDSRGPLYEGHFLSDIDQGADIVYGRPANDRLAFPKLLLAAQEPSPPKRLAGLESVLDMDRFTRLLALDMLAWNGDGYSLHANNYRIFDDRPRQRFVFLPHGMDQMFTITDAPILASGDGLVARAVLSLPECRALVIDHIREFRNSFFQPDIISRRALEIAAAIAPQAPPDQAQAVSDLIQRITERLHSIDQQLAGITNLASIRAGQTVALTGWTNRTIAGTPLFFQAVDLSSVGVRSSTNSAGAWLTSIWLEEGRYRLQGRVRSGNVASAATNHISAAFRVRSPRKRSMGLDWGWDSRRRAEYRPGGETGNLAYQALASTSGTNWTELACEIDLRQPIADLELFCEASGVGEAEFDLRSLKLTRLTDPGR